MEIQWLPGISSDTHRLDKQRGSGVSPAVFPPTFGRPKVGPPEANPGVWGRGGPNSKHRVRGRSPGFAPARPATGKSALWEPRRCKSRRFCYN